MLEIAIIAGIAILAIAALSQMQQMWAGARFGLEENPRSPDFHDQQSFFHAWSKACRRLGFELPDEHTSPSDHRAPSATGTRRGLKTHLSMRLESTSGPIDPDHINPASTHCPITARIDLPFPWHAVSVHRFAHSRGFDPGDPDDLSLHLELSHLDHIDGLRLDDRARQALSDAVDDLDALRIKQGVAQIRQVADPERNVGQWPQIFEDAISPIFAHLSQFCAGGLHIQARCQGLPAPLTIALQPGNHPQRPCQALFSMTGEAAADLHAKLQRHPPDHLDGLHLEGDTLQWRFALPCNASPQRTADALDRTLGELLSRL